MNSNLTGAARFGMRLAAARAANGWTQDELAAKANVNGAQVSYIERGARGCNLATGVRLAAAAGISLDGLLDPCTLCGDSPPAGFSCNECGARSAT